MFKSCHFLKKLTFATALTLASLGATVQAAAPVANNAPSASNSAPAAAYETEGLVTPAFKRIPVLLQPSVPLMRGEKGPDSRDLLLPVVSMDMLPELQALGAKRCVFHATLPQNLASMTSITPDTVMCYDSEGQQLGEGRLTSHLDLQHETHAKFEILVLDGGVIRWTKS